MPAVVDSYQLSAKYYDAAYATMKDLVDAAFYLDLARQSGGPVLEIGCGTGRILLPIARQGIAIHGVDNSAPMMAILKQKLLQEAPAVRSKVSLHAGDMRELRLDRKFALVTIPFRPMQHMHTLRDQLRALTSAACHLAEDGKLVFDVFYPKYDLLPMAMGQEILEAEWSPASDPETVVRRYFRKTEFDKIHQSFTFTFYFRTFHRGQPTREETETLKLSYFTYPHLQALFLLAGLEPVAEYGSFDRAPLDNRSQEMIFILRKARP